MIGVVSVQENQLRLIALIQAPWFDGSPPWPWPIASIPAFHRFRVHGGMAPEEVGSVVAALIPSEEVVPGSDAGAIFRQLADLEYFSLPGGLAVNSGGKTVICSGCCSGLEEW